MKYIKLSFIILMMCMFTACSNEHSENTSTDTEYNGVNTSEYESDGIKYVVCQGKKLKITYPVIDYNYTDEELIGTYDIGILGAGKYPEDGDETYIVSAVIEWPSMYGDREISLSLIHI